ncbi:proteasome subunit alpha type-3-like [Argiope bruennichi]|uniref:Proteasome subunit alpha type n=1 Tax=Argiope bruennichi TaxID=94029 RepID=A0A8T0ECD4_ARGBR|nr:proteasome subunit alpha type-3-like [Argiope bruennichi]KAF8768462.1 Proteasome subunit alpha type-3 like protein [Argiope bruennichi]
MSSTATGYDQLASQFSPDGRLFQVEYAKKALLKSGTAVGLRGKSCVVLAAEKIASSKLYESSAMNKIFSADWHIGLALIGYVPDGQHLLQTARNEAVTYKLNYKQDIPVQHLKLRTAMYMHTYTLFGALRPFGAGLMLASSQPCPQLFCIDPLGTVNSYSGYAIGRNEAAAKTEIEKLDLKNMSGLEMAHEAVKILYMIHDEKDKEFDIELSWVGRNTKGKHVKVPETILRKAKEWAVAAVDELNSDEEI